MTRIFSGEVRVGQKLYVLRDATGEGQKQVEKDESGESSARLGDRFRIMLL